MASRFLTNLATQAPALIPTPSPGDDQTGGYVFVDVDDTIIEVHGHKKQGVGFGYSKVRGLNALLATVTTKQSAPVVVAQRLRKGSCGSPRGAHRFIADAIAATRRLPDMTGKKILVRADSAFYGRPSINAAITAGADVSVTVRMDPNVKRAITQIPADAWQTIQYTDAIFDEDTGRWISSADVAEVPFTAFGSRKKFQQVPGRLVVRRIPELNKNNLDQPGLFDLHRFHGLFTTSDLDTVAADKTHRSHAIIEQVNADLKKQCSGTSAVGDVHRERGLAGVCGHGVQPHPHRGCGRCRRDGQGHHRDDPTHDHRHSCPDRPQVPPAGPAPTEGMDMGVAVVQVV